MNYYGISDYYRSVPEIDKWTHYSPPALLRTNSLHIRTRAQPEVPKSGNLDARGAYI